MMETNGSETAESQGTVTSEPSGAEKTGSHGAIRYLAVLVAVAAMMVVVFYLFGGQGAGTTTITTVFPSPTTLSVTTTVTVLTFAPVVANFTRNNLITTISKTSPLSQGAAHGYLFTYSGQNAGQILTIRTLTYANVSGMVSQYNFIAAGLQNDTIAFNSLPANATGGKVKQAPSGTSLYSITAYSGNTLITTSLISPSSSDVGQNVSASILIGALNDTRADLANLT